MQKVTFDSFQKNRKDENWSEGRPRLYCNMYRYSSLENLQICNTDKRTFESCDVQCAELTFTHMILYSTLRSVMLSGMAS